GPAACRSATAATPVKPRAIQYWARKKRGLSGVPATRSNDAARPQARRKQKVASMATAAAPARGYEGRSRHARRPKTRAISSVRVDSLFLKAPRMALVVQTLSGLRTP